MRRKTLWTNLGRTDSSALAGSWPRRDNSDVKLQSFEVGRYEPSWLGENRVPTCLLITWVVQLTLDRCGVVLMDHSQVRTALAPQPQRVPPHSTDSDSGSPVARGGQSTATGDSKLRLAHGHCMQMT